MVGFGELRWLSYAEAAALASALAGAIWDIRTRRVPNALTFGTAIAALVVHLLSGGWQGLGWVATGWAVGLAMFLPLFLLGGLGAGDVKLLAALGAWLGPAGALWIGVYGAIAGGVLAVVVAAWRGYFRTAIRNLWGLLCYWKVMGVRPLPQLTLESGAGPRLPYAVAIFAGAALSIWLR